MSNRSLALRLFLTCWLVYAAHFATNIVREIYPALSLGDRLSLDVSEYDNLHPDIFTLPGRGTYINNNPGASILGALPYAVARPAIEAASARIQAQRARTGAAPPQYDTEYANGRRFVAAAWERGLDVKLVLGAGVVQFFLMAPLSALAAVVMFYLLLGYGVRRRPALLLALLYAFATPVFYRTSQLNHNLLIAHFALFAFGLLRRYEAEDDGQGGGRKLAAAGLLAGWCVVLDYSGLIALGGLTGYFLAGWWRSARSRAHLASFGLGAALSLAILLVYQWQAFGSPLAPAQSFMPPTQYSGYGYNGITWPQGDLLWDTAFGLRFGLFASAPLLLLALYPPAWIDRRIRLVSRRDAWLIFGVTLGLFLFSAANQYGRLQFNSGVRYMVPVVPFLFLIAAGALLRLPRALSIGGGIFATYWSWCLTMYRDVEGGIGIPEAIRHISLEGPRLPWIATLERLGYVTEGLWTAPALGLVVLLVAAIWLVGQPLAGFRSRANVPLHHGQQHKEAS